MISDRILKTLPGILAVLLYSSGFAEDSLWKISPDTIPNSELSALVQETPHSAKPRTWWHWLNGNVSRQGITEDLEAMAEQGYGGVALFNAGLWMPDGGNDFLSESWINHVTWAAQECKRLGLDFSLHNCDGWSQSFGPWIKPEQSMQMLTWTETTLPANHTGKIHLPEPGKRLGQYTDIATLAYPAMEETLLEPIEVIGPAKQGEYYDLTARFSEPVPLGSISFAGSKIKGARFYEDINAELFVSQDGKDYEKINNIELNIVQDLGTNEITLWVPAEPSRYYRLRIHTAKPFNPGRITYSTAERVQHWAWKSYLGQKRWYGAGARQLTEESVPPVGKHSRGSLAREDLVVVTERLKPDGTLEWKKPDDRTWKILRVGFTPTARGANPNVATHAGRGLECDKFSAEAVRYHYEQYVINLKKRIDKVAPGAMTSFETDSWECGIQNWTSGFEARFEKAFGYDIQEFFPLMLTGTTIGSLDQSSRVLWDWRRFIADQLAQEYYATGRKVAEENAMSYVAEAGGGLQPYADSVGFFNEVDIPMGEFWTDSTTRQGDVTDGVLGMKIDGKLAASSAHTRGGNLAAAEAFTTSPSILFRNHPQRIKKLGDMAFCAGLNQFYFHTFPHRAGYQIQPGITMAYWGMHNNPSNTWWESGKAWIEYLTRCQTLLQAGRFHADILMYSGESIPNFVGWQKEQILPVPAGYDWDVCDFNTLKEAWVEDGVIVLPSGMRYHLLVCPADTRMRPDVVHRIADLTAQGARIMCPKPTASPSFEHYAEADAWITKTAAKVWGSWETNKGDLLVRAYGDGVLMWSDNMQDALDHIGLQPDFQPSTVGFASTDFIHRVVGDTHIYFIRNDEAKRTRKSYRFRVTGKQPELWDPVTGTRAKVQHWKADSDSTTLPIELYPFGSTFVIFQEKGRPGFKKTAKEERTILSIEGPWQVTFPKGRGAPDKITLEKLVSWTEQDDFGVKHFSGTATYRTDFGLPTGSSLHDAALYLDLGDVKNIAEVRINGIGAGSAWTYPYRVELTPHLKTGSNMLEIDVTNTWANRLIGDAHNAPPFQGNNKNKLIIAEFPTWFTRDTREVPGERIGFVPNNIFKKESPLEPSGLLGPVRILAIPQ